MNMTELCDSKFNNAAFLLHVDVITFFLSSVSTYLNYVKRSQRLTLVHEVTKTSITVKTG